MARFGLIFKLGVLNVLRVIWYRLRLKSYFGRSFKILPLSAEGDFFLKPQDVVVGPQKSAGRNLASHRYFGHLDFPVLSDVPDWHYNPISKVRSTKQNCDFWEISDFSEEVGDIKIIWELSRFEWVVFLAKLTAQGDEGALLILNNWLKDWCANNPPYKGLNWKCGQESSIRVMHLAVAAFLLKQSNPINSNIVSLIKLHLRRIEPTLSYAIAQDNNHGTSEAAALFIGGSMLSYAGVEEGSRWQKKGRQCLEERVGRLIGKSGSFSQYSLNYHRLMLDTLSIVEFLRCHYDLPNFTAKFYEKASLATLWLYRMVDPISGDGPNVGANDGAQILQLSETDYRDFRPSVQLGMSIFLSAKAYPEDGSWNEPLRWLGLTEPSKKAPPLDSCIMDDGGFAVLRIDKAFAMLRYPRFRFRPSQADILHVDFWLNGRNVLRDGGTYSYNADPDTIDYFSGTASHNTIQFDDRDQMSRVSRFLFKDWLKASDAVSISSQPHSVSVTAGYVDKRQVSHKRTVLLSDKLTIIDEVEGFDRKAVLRWRLEPGDWTIEDNAVRNGDHILKVQGSMSFSRFALVTGWESRYYLDKEELPVLEIEIDQPGTLRTEYHWAP